MRGTLDDFRLRYLRAVQHLIALHDDAVPPSPEYQSA
jgi:hypothetical protein